MKPIIYHCLFLSLLIILGLSRAEAGLPDGRYLYVATPGIRNYLEYGGHGLLVYNIDDDYRLVKRIATAGLNAEGAPENVKGVCASAATGLLHIANLSTLTCVDLVTEKVLWEKAYDGGCDRMGIAPDGSFLYLPTLEKADWHVVNAKEGTVLSKISPDSKSHNTIVGRNGKEAYLAGLGSPWLTVADTAKHEAVRKVGPFSNNIRPFTVNAAQTRVYVNINDLLGFEIGDLTNGKMLTRVEVKGFEMGPVKRHGCPSHGIALTPNGREVWVSDGHNSQIHVFALEGDTATQVASIAVRDQPGWITMRLDGKHAWSSSGEVIEIASRRIVKALSDENARDVGSEKMVEVHWKDGKPVLCGDQFGYGRVE